MAETPATVVHSPAPPNVKELSNALDAVVDWCTLGIKLGLETAELRRIENDYPHNNAECKSEMLASCLRSDHPPSWKVVVDALCWMGEHLSACKIWRKYLKSMKGQGATHAHKDRASCLVAEYIIKSKFASLLALGHHKLRGKISDMQNFRVFLACCYLPEDDSNDSRAVDASDFVGKVLDATQNFSDVLTALSSRGMLSYKNCHILRSIIDKYASDDQELMEEMRKYDEELAEYAPITCMKEYVDAVSQQDEESEADLELFSVLSFKVGRKATEHTLQYVVDFWDSLAHRLKLPHSALLFERVAEGCIEMIWKVPSHLTSFIIRRAQENTEYFREQRVLRVTIANTCIYEWNTLTPENINEDPNWRKQGDPGDGLLAHEVGHQEENITDPGRKRDPVVEELEDISKVKDPRPGDFDEGSFPTADFDDSSEDEYQDDAEALPEHELRLRSAMVISSNYSLLWQYLDPSRLLPKLFDKFLITEEMMEEAVSYSQYAQTAIILRGFFDDYTPPNRLFKLCDTLDTIPGQEHLGRKLLQDYKHPPTLSAHSPIPSVAATHSDFSEMSQQFQQLQHEAIDLLDRIPNTLAKLKQVLAALVFPRGKGRVVPLIDPRSYENALTVQQLFRCLAPHWNPLSPDLLGLLTSGYSMVATKVAEFIEAKNNKDHLVLCVQQIPSLVDLRSVHSAPLSQLQSLNHSQLPKHEVTSSWNNIRISVEVDQNRIQLSDFERITTALSGLFRMPKVAFVFIGFSQQPLVLSWLTIPEILEWSWDSVTDLSGYRFLAETRVTRIAVGDWFYQCPTIKEVELLEASCYGLLDTAILLTNSGTNVNVATRVGVMPLFIACRKGHCDIVECLLRANADVNLQTKVGWSPLHIACQENHGEIVDRLLIAKADVNLQLKTGATPLYVACSNGHTEIVDQLLTAKADVNLQRKDGTTPLMVASRQGYLSVVRILLQAGATVNTTSQDGYTALLLAADREHEDVVQLLIEVDADPDLQDKNQETALMRAAGEGNVGIVKMLNQHGANFKLTNKDGRTALHIAASCGHEDVLELLLEANMDPDIKDKNGFTPLMLASLNGHSSVVRLLLLAGATVNSTTQNGFTPLMVASQEGHSSVVRILLQAGATVNTTNQDGLTALDLARLMGHAEVCQELITCCVPDQEEEEDEPQPSQPFEATESPIVDVPGQKEGGDEPQSLIDKAALATALENERMMPLRIAQCMTVGAPQSGKSSLKRRLLKQPNQPNKSTGVADKPEVVSVVTVGGSEWTVIEWEEEGAQFLQSVEQSSEEETENKQLPSFPTSIPDGGEGTKESEGSCFPRDEPSIATKEPEQETTLCVDVSNDSVPHQHSLSYSKSTVTEADINPNEPERPSYRDLIDAILSEFGSEKWIAAKKRLENQCTIYFTDSGGQLEFQELLPAIISGPSIFLLVFNLEHAAEGLEKEFSAVYKRSDGSVYEPPPGISTFTVKDSILHILASIQATRSYHFQKDGSDQIIEAKVLLVGTHSDHVKDASVRNQIESDVQDLLKNTPYYQKGMLQVPCRKKTSERFVYMVNNESLEDPVVQEIREKVTSLIFRDSDYKEDVSAHWLGFDLMLRWPGKSQILTYERCTDLANECGIRGDDNIKQALSFLHERFGIIRYFKGEGLGKLVVTNPQVIYNVLSDLVAEQFNDSDSDSRLTPEQVNEFRNKGLISEDAVKRITTQKSETPGLSLPFLLSLLTHLHIVVKLEVDEANPVTKYFMPCVLAGTIRDLSISEEISEPCVADLLIVFDHGRQYCPKGLFAVLAVNLTQKPKQHEAQYTWVLNCEKLARERVVFHLNVQDPWCRYTVHIQHGLIGSRSVLRIFVEKLRNRLSKQLCPENLEGVCKEICDSVKGAIKSSLDELNKSTKFNIGFYSMCNMNQPSSKNHISIIEDPSQQHLGVPQDMTCIECANDDYPLEEEHKVWFKEVPQRLESRSEVPPSPAPPSSTAATGSGTAHPRTVNRTTTLATLLKPDDMKILKPLIQPIAAYWVEFADQLGMESYVSTIQATPANTNPPACLRDLLNRWLHHGHPYLEALCQALRGDPEIIGGVGVATNLEEQFQDQRVNRTTTPATLLKPDDMKILKPLIQPIAAYWVAFADQLGMGLYVSTIQATPTNTNPPACLRDLLNRWIHHGQPSLEALCQALRGDPEIIGGNSVAMKLEEQFQG